ncbi:MAG TPA: NAD-binding protein [Streptosporangiaceae bacterium]
MTSDAADRAGRDHLIVCGDDALTARVAEELTARYDQTVTAIVRSASSGYGQRIARLPGVRVMERAELDHRAFVDADVASARALAVLHQDDLGNFHAALRAQELNPDLRLVLSIFNTGLGERIGTFFSDCAVLSESRTAAPSFVAAALGEPAPSHVRLAGRTLYVARRDAVRPDRVVCGLGTDAEAGVPRLVGPADASAGLVLVVADGAPRNPLARRRNPLRAAWRLLRMLFGHRIGAAFAVLIAVLLAGFALLATVFSAGSALYLTLLDAAGAAVSDSTLPGTEKLAQTMLTFDGMAFLPLVTAAVVGARLTGSVHGANRQLTDHVIVAGLGNVGTRIVGQLHDLGIDVVCVDRSGSAAGIAMARRLGLKVVIGETHREETLREAGVGTCQALVSVTNSDIANLETALHARALAEQPKIVVRLNDDDLAERIGKHVTNTISRSVSYLAAPAFAAAMLEHRVLSTIAVGRHVLLIADVVIGQHSELEDRPLDEVHDGGGQLRVIALRRPGLDAVDWSPQAQYRLRAQDRLVVLANRTGLSSVLTRSQAG